MKLRRPNERAPFLGAARLRLQDSWRQGFAREQPLLPDEIVSSVDLEAWLQAIKIKDLEAELADRENSIRLLRQRIAALQFRNHEENAIAATVVEIVGRIIAVSERLFPGPVAVDYAFDPENPDDEYLVFDVVAQGEYKGYRESVFQWHDEVRKIVPGTLGEFRLSVMPQR